MDVGDRVTIIALRPELNGKQGCILSYDSAARRYAVLLEGEAESMAVEPANLHPHASPLDEARAAVARAVASSRVILAREVSLKS